MTNCRRTLQLSLLLGSLPAALLVAGCGSKTPTASTNTAAAGNPAAAAFHYARCMRDHGIPGFPDPQVSTTAHGGSIRQAVPASAGLSPKFPAAQKACRGILPPPSNSGDSEDQARRPYMLAFARCLRSHGVSSFPDPDRNGHLTLQMISAAGVDLHTHEVLNAGIACVGVTHGTVTAAQVRALVTGRH